MCAKLRTYKLLLLLRLSGAYSIIQIGLYLQVILYMLFTSHDTIAYIRSDIEVGAFIHKKQYDCFVERYQSKIK